jgi:hypothetical protein
VKPTGLGVGVELLLPQPAIKRMLTIAARAISRRPAHLVEARGFIIHSCLYSSYDALTPTVKESFCEKD